MEEVLALGLRRGEVVRFRTNDHRRWQVGRVHGIERDGSVGIVDGKGASRAVLAERVEVKRPGVRGGARWEALLDHASRPEQLGLL